MVKVIVTLLSAFRFCF